MGSSNEWIIKDGKLCKTFVFGSFLEVISFMNRASVEIDLNIPGETGLYMLELRAAEHQALMRVLKN